MNTSIQTFYQKKGLLKIILPILTLLTLFSLQANSQNWLPIGGGTNWEYSLVVYNNELYAGEQSGNGGHGVKKFNGTSWSDLAVSTEQ